MTRAGVVILLGAAFVGGALGRWSVPASAAPEAKPIDVSVSRIGKDYRLIGRTGVPLGQVCSFEAVIAQGPPNQFKFPNTLVLHIQKIDGAPVEPGIWFPLGEVDAPEWFQFQVDQERLKQVKDAPKTGQVLRFRGCEQGSYPLPLAELTVDSFGPDVPIPSNGDGYRGSWRSRLCVYKLDVK